MKIYKFIRKLFKSSYFKLKMILYYFFPIWISEIILASEIDYLNQEITEEKIFYTDKKNWKNIQPNSDNFFHQDVLIEKYLNIEFKQSILKFKESKILGIFGVVIYNKRIFIKSFTHDYNKETFINSRNISKKVYDRNYLRKFLFKKPLKFNKVLNLSTSHSGANYYHFLIDMIPKFSIMLKDIHKFDLIVFNGPPSQFLVELIDLMKINDKAHITSKDTAIFADEIVVPNMLSELGNPNFEIIHQIRILFSERKYQHNLNYERIFISREKAGTRKVQNEQEIIEFLTNYGFVKINLEELNILSQISLFESAKIIIGSHGAGFANLVFSNDKSKVLELFSSKYIEPCMFRICQAIGIEYHYLVFDSINDKNDIVVDLIRFKEYFKGSILINE